MPLFQASVLEVTEAPGLSNFGRMPSASRLAGLPYGSLPANNNAPGLERDAMDRVADDHMLFDCVKLK